MVVNKSLSRGLADLALGQIKEQTNGYAADVRRSLMNAKAYPPRRETVRRIATSLMDCGERYSMMQVLGRHSKWRWASLAVFIPDVARQADGQSDRLLSFGLFRILIQVGRPFGVQRGFPVALSIQEHAIERLFQRLNVLDPATVCDEMHDAMCMSIPLQCAAWRQEFRQIVLPTRSGAFLCSFEPDGKLVAKTWIERPESLSRHGAVIGAIEACHRSCAAEIEIAQELAALPIEAELLDFPVSDALIDCLGQFSWLREEYVPRADPVGEIWRRARAASGE